MCDEVKSPIPLTKLQNSRRHNNVAHSISKQQSFYENARTSRASAAK
jgi:hypothetical protein